MDYTVYRLNLDTTTHRSQAVVKCFKGDTSIKLVFMLTAGGKVLTVPDGAVATLSLTMPDNNKVRHACYIKDNSVVYTFTGDTTEFSGESGAIDAQLFVYHGVTYDSEGVAIYPDTSIMPRFTIEVARTADKPTNPMYEGINDAVGIVMGAAAAETQREANENKREESYENAINTANEAKSIAEEANTTSNEAMGTAEGANTKAKDAIIIAEDARGIANDAKSTAESADTKARSAFILADGADTKANEAKSIAEGATNTADTARADAEEALSKSETALSAITYATLTYSRDTGKLAFAYYLNGELVKTPEIDLPTESVIMNMYETVNADGVPILRLELASGVVTDVTLDNIFAGLATKKELDSAVAIMATTSALNDVVKRTVTHEQLNSAIENLATEEYVDNAVANAGGGGAKLYCHRISISSDFGEEWMDNPQFYFTGVVYKSTATPIQSIADVTNEDLMSFRPNTFWLWDSPEENKFAYEFSKNKNTNVFMIGYIDGWEDWGGRHTPTWGQIEVYPSNITVVDTVTEV